MLDFFSPFTFLFRDKDWLKKFAFASLLTYTLIGAAPVMGWTVEIVRRVGSGNISELPDWEDWKPYWKLGAQFVSINVLWLLPLVLAVIVLYLPLLFVNRLSGETLLIVWGGTLLCVLIFLLIYSIIYGLFFPAMLVTLAGTGLTWASADPFRLWKIVRRHFVGYLFVFIIVGLGLFNVVLSLSALTLFLLPAAPAGLPQPRQRPFCRPIDEPGQVSSPRLKRGSQGVRDFNCLLFLPPLLVYPGVVTAHFTGQHYQPGR